LGLTRNLGARQLVFWLRVKAHYSDSFCGTFWYNIIIHTILLLQKHGTFNFVYQRWFLGLTIIIFTKLMLFIIIQKIIINFIIYIEGSISIFIIYISIIRAWFHFDYTNFRASLVIKIINFSEFLKMAHRGMFFIFYVDVIFCQNFNLPHIYHIFAQKTHFLKWKFTNYSHGIQTLFILCEMTWFNIPLIFNKNLKSFKLFFEYICVFEYTCTIHSFSQIYSNLPFYKIKLNIYFLNLLPKLYSNTICKHIVKIFWKFEAGYIQTCTSLESNTMWHLEGGHCNVLSP